MGDIGGEDAASSKDNRGGMVRLSLKARWRMYPKDYGDKVLPNKEGREKGVMGASARSEREKVTVHH